MTRTLINVKSKKNCMRNPRSQTSEMIRTDLDKIYVQLLFFVNYKIFFFIKEKPQNPQINNNKYIILWKREQIFLTSHTIFHRKKLDNNHLRIYISSLKNILINLVISTIPKKHLFFLTTNILGICSAFGPTNHNSDHNYFFLRHL